MCCYKLVARSFSRFSKIAAYALPFLVMVSLFMWPCPGQAELDSSGAIQGQITGPDGQPVANLQVLAAEHNRFYGPLLPYSFDPWVPEEIVQDHQQQESPYFYYPSFAPYPTIYRTGTQPDGAFLLEGLPDGRYILWAYDPQGRGFCPAIFGAQQGSQPCDGSFGYSDLPVYIPVHVSAGETAGPVHMDMEMGGGIAGRITDAADGSPIAGAIIQIRPYREEGCPIYWPPFFTDSDANGDFSVVGLPEGEYTLQIIEAEGYIVQSPYAGYMYSPDTGDTDETVYTVVAGQITDGGHLTLRAGGVIEGTVTSQADGSSIPDISVFSYKPEGGYGYYPVGGRRTDQNGVYHLSGLEGEYIIYIPHTSEFQGAYYDHTQDPEAALSIMVEAGEYIGSIDFQLASSAGKGSIQGQIVEEGTGMALAGIMVYIMEITPPPDILYPDPDEDEASTGYYSYYYEPQPPPLITPTPIPTDDQGGFAFSGLSAGDYRLGVLDPEGRYLSSSYPLEGESINPYYPEGSDSIALAENQVIDNIRIPLRGGGCLEGQILDGSTPVAGVEVQVLNLPAYETYGYGYGYGYGYQLSDISDTEGKFSLCGVDESEFILVAQDRYDRGYGLNFPVDPNDMSVPAIFSVPSGGMISDIVITMNRGFTLQGLVADAGGNPLAGIQVTAEPISLAFLDANREDYTDLVADRYVSHAASREDGFYTFTGLSEGTYQITAEDPNSIYLPGELPEMSIYSDMNAPDLILTRGGILSGTVADSEGNPLAGIEVVAYISPSYPSYPYPWTPGDYSGDPNSYTSDPDIYFSDPNIYEGDPNIPLYDPNSYTSGSGIPSYDPNTYEGDPNMPLYDPNDPYLTYGQEDDFPYSDSNSTFAYPDSTYSDTGYSGGSYGGYGQGDSTYDGYSYPSSYPDYSQYFRTKTREDGTYEIRGLKEGDYRLEARDPQGNYLRAVYQGNSSSWSIVVGAGVRISNLDFSLALGGIIEGRVLDGATGNPVPEVKVEAESSSNPGYVYSSPTDEQGYYTIRSLPAGSYTLSVSSVASYLTQYYMEVGSHDEATSVEVNPGQTCANIDFHLQEGAGLSGTIRDAATGQILSTTCTVTLLDEQEDTVKKTYSDAQGEYTFAGLAPGNYKIWVTYAYGYYSGCYSEETADPEGCTLITVSQTGTAAGYDLFISPRASISGRVVDELDGRPLANKRVLAISEGYDPNVLYYYGYGGSFALYDSNLPYMFTMFTDPDGWDGGGDLFPIVRMHMQYAYTDPNGWYTIKDLEGGNYRVLALDPYYIYGAEYYPGVPADQMDQAGIISLGRSEARTGIDFTLQVGGTQSVYDSSSRDSSSSSSYGSYSESSFLPFSGGYYGAYSSAFYSPSLSSGQPEPPEQPPQESPSLEIISLPEESIVAGLTYTYQVVAQDSRPAGAFTYDLKCRPEGMSIDPATGEITWQPKNDDAGQSIVQIAVSNEFNNTAFQSYRLRVDADTVPPEEVTGVQARAGDKKVTVSWVPCEDSAGDLAGLTLYMAGGQGYGEGISLDATATEYTARDLQNGQAYSFKITTRDLLGNESAGVVVKATPRKAQTASQTPRLSTNVWNSPYDWFNLSASPLSFLPSYQMTWSPRLDQSSWLRSPSLLTSPLRIPTPWTWTDASPYALLPWNDPSSLSRWSLDTAFSIPDSISAAFRQQIPDWSLNAPYPYPLDPSPYGLWDPYDFWSQLFQPAVNRLYRPALNQLYQTEGNQQGKFPSNLWETYNGYTIPISDLLSIF